MRCENLILLVVLQPFILHEVVSVPWSLWCTHGSFTVSLHLACSLGLPKRSRINGECGLGGALLVLGIL